MPRLATVLNNDYVGYQCSYISFPTLPNLLSNWDFPVTSRPVPSDHFSSIGESPVINVSYSKQGQEWFFIEWYVIVKSAALSRLIYDVIHGGANIIFGVRSQFRLRYKSLFDILLAQISFLFMCLIKLPELNINLNWKQGKVDVKRVPKRCD